MAKIIPFKVTDQRKSITTHSTYFNPGTPSWGRSQRPSTTAVYSLPCHIMYSYLSFIFPILPKKQALNLHLIAAQEPKSESPRADLRWLFRSLYFAGSEILTLASPFLLSHTLSICLYFLSVVDVRASQSLPARVLGPLAMSSTRQQRGMFSSSSPVLRLFRSPFVSFRLGWNLLTISSPPYPQDDHHLF